MSWAGRRKALIITVGSIALLAILAIFAFSILYDTPTCTDRKQNQGEAGVDCGGECARLCAFQVRSEPVVQWARTVTPEPGRVDVIAYVDNRNTDAVSRKAVFMLEVYDQYQTQIAKKVIQVDLPESTTVPVYIPNAAPRGSEAVQAFLTYMPEETVWVRGSGEDRPIPTVESVERIEAPEPRITAKLSNPLADPMRNLTLVATLFDPSGNAMAASQTVVPNLPAQGTAPVVFTWPAPFEAPVARIEILPVPAVRVP